MMSCRVDSNFLVYNTYSYIHELDMWISSGIQNMKSNFPTFNVTVMSGRGVRDGHSEEAVSNPHSNLYRKRNFYAREIFCEVFFVPTVYQRFEKPTRRSQKWHNLSQNMFTDLIYHLTRYTSVLYTKDSNPRRTVLKSINLGKTLARSDTK